MTGAAIPNHHAATRPRGNQRLHESVDQRDGGLHPSKATDGVHITSKVRGTGDPFAGKEMNRRLFP